MQVIPIPSKIKMQKPKLNTCIQNFINNIFAYNTACPSQNKYMISSIHSLMLLWFRKF